MLDRFLTFNQDLEVVMNKFKPRYILSKLSGAAVWEFYEHQQSLQSAVMPRMSKISP